MFAISNLYLFMNQVKFDFPIVLFFLLSFGTKKKA